MKAVFKRAFLSAALPFLLAGCSYYADFYIVNLSDAPVAAVLKLDRVPEESSSALILSYAAGVMDIGDKTAQKLDKKLAYEFAPGDLTVHIEIPANSTLLVGGSYNALPLESFVLRLPSGDQKYDLPDGSFRKELKRSGGKFPPYHFAFTIERRP